MSQCIPFRMNFFRHMRFFMKPSANATFNSLITIGSLELLAVISTVESMTCTQVEDHEGLTN